MLLTVMYHLLGEHDFGHPISAQEFKQQLDWLESVGQIVTPKQAREAGKSKDIHVLLTFDDGTLDHFCAATSILGARNLKGVFNVTIKGMREETLPVHMLWKIIEAAQINDTEERAIKDFFHGKLSGRITEKLFKAMQLDPVEYMSFTHARDLRSLGHALGLHGLAHEPIETYGDWNEAARIFHAEMDEKPSFWCRPWHGHYGRKELVAPLDKPEFTAARGLTPELAFWDGENARIPRFDTKLLPPFNHMIGDWIMQLRNTKESWVDERTTRSSNAS